MNLWQVDIHPAKGQPDTLGSHAEVAARELGIADGLRVAGVQGFLIQSRCDAQSASLWAREYLADPIAQRVVVAKVGDASLLDSGREHSGKLLHVLYKPGVMDPVAQSTLGMFGGLGCLQLLVSACVVLQQAQQDSLCAVFHLVFTVLFCWLFYFWFNHI